MLKNAATYKADSSLDHYLHSFFRVYENCELHIEGTSKTRRIIFDGGYVRGSNEVGLVSEMVGSAGTLSLNYCVFRNNRETASDKFFPAIKINPGWKNNQKLGPTTINNCEFYNLDSVLAPVLFTDEPGTTPSATNNTPTSCPIVISNTTIHDCKVLGGDGGNTATDPGAGWGGLIRTRGGWVGNMTLNNVEMFNNEASYSCAGVFWNAFGNRSTKKPTLTIKGCNFHNNTAGYSGGAMRIETDCTFEAPVTKIHNNTANYLGGGIHIYGYAGGETKNFTAPTSFDYDLNENLEIYDNVAQYGAGIGFQLTSECKLYEGSSFNAFFNGAKIHGNHAKIKGGGLFFEDISGLTKADGSNKFTVNIYLNKGTLEGNYAAPTKTETYDVRDVGFYGSDEKWRSCGGGIFLNKANIEYNPAKAGDMILNNNFASLNGGAIFVTGKKNYLKLNSLTASNNKANNGGAVACISINEPSSTTNPTTYQSAVTVDNAKFIGNYAAQRGGAIYNERGNVTLQNEAEFKENHAKWCGGAIYSYFKTYLTIGKVSFLSNWCDYTGMEDNAAQNKGLGGAICLEQGCTLTIGSNDASKETIFDGNHCQNSGGALHVVNTWTNPACYDYVTGSIKNATFKNNYAYRGGAICFDGEGSGDNIQPTLKNNKIINNKANIGGGLYLSQCKIKYEGGLIKNNYAEGNSITAKTSYTENPWLDTTSDFHKLAGFGGGVFMTTNGYLDISTAYDFGIYGNRADTGGDDITCQKTTGTINLPDVTSLNLEGFTVPVPKTAVRWMEDYNKEDSNYSYGTNKLSGTTNYDRYTNLLASATGQALLSKVIVAPGTYTGKYLNLALGYNFIFVKVRKHGLKVGDSAIFKISYDNNGSKTHYMTIAVTNTGTNQNADGSVEQTVALTQGTWTVEETSWSWTYTPTTSSIAKTLTVEANSATPFVFDFTNTRKDGIDSTAPNAEGYKQNEFKN